MTAAGYQMGEQSQKAWRTGDRKLMWSLGAGLDAVPAPAQRVLLHHPDAASTQRLNHRRSIFIERLNLNLDFLSVT